MLCSLNLELTSHIGKHHETKPSMKKNERIAKLLESLLSSVSSALKAPVCKSAVELDLRSSLIRVQEASLFILLLIYL